MVESSVPGDSPSQFPLVRLSCLDDDMPGRESVLRRRWTSAHLQPCSGHEALRYPHRRAFAQAPHQLSNNRRNPQVCQCRDGGKSCRRSGRWRRRRARVPVADEKPVLGKVSSSSYQMGFTVSRRSNSFFSHPYLLGRSMVFNEHTLEDFAGLLAVRETF